MPIICTKKFSYRKDGEIKAKWRTFHERDVLTEKDVIAFATEREFCIDTDKKADAGAAASREAPKTEASDAGAAEGGEPGSDGVERPALGDAQAGDPAPRRGRR